MLTNIAKRTRKLVHEAAIQKAVAIVGPYLSFSKLKSCWGLSGSSMGSTPLIPCRRPTEMIKKLLILARRLAATGCLGALTSAKKVCG